MKLLTLALLALVLTTTANANGWTNHYQNYQKKQYQPLNLGNNGWREIKQRQDREQQQFGRQYNQQRTNDNLRDINNTLRSW